MSWCFVVEMQLIHVPGFVNRVVYNACKAYVNQLKVGQSYAVLADVVAISICDFALWPDDEQRARGLPLVPMLSRWNVREQKSGNHGLLQVQYAFLELPKVPSEKPAQGADLWAWLFVHAPELTELPPDLPEGPYREALALANQSTFTQAELDAYQKVIDEIQQLRDLVMAKWAEGKAEGLAEGEIKGEVKGELRTARSAVLEVLEARFDQVPADVQQAVASLSDVALLKQLLRVAARAADLDQLREQLQAAGATS